MFRLHNLPDGERDGYYTKDQIIGAIVKITSDADDDPYPSHFINHLSDIRDKMDKYQMEIICANEVIQYDQWCHKMVGTYNIHPFPFKSKKCTYTDHKTTAPNYRSVQVCGNCKHFCDETEPDDGLNGVCNIHTSLNTDYDPPLKEPLVLICGGVCDDFIINGAQ